MLSCSLALLRARHGGAADWGPARVTARLLRCALLCQQRLKEAWVLLLHQELLLEHVLVGPAGASCTTHYTSSSCEFYVSQCRSVNVGQVVCMCVLTSDSCSTTHSHHPPHAAGWQADGDLNMLHTCQHATSCTGLIFEWSSEA